MNNQEAIETLMANYPDSHYSMLREAVDKAVEALKKADIDEAPVVDIVRCGECEWQGFYQHCRYFRDIDFCSHGVRKVR